MMEVLQKLAVSHGLLVAFTLIGAVMWVSYWISKYLTFGRIHGSAIAIVIGLILALVGGMATGGEKGLVDVPMFIGIGLLGGGMLRDFAIVATAFDVDVTEARKSGLVGAIALAFGTLLPFTIGVAVGWGFGYRDAVSLSTIGAGAITYIVGPVTGAAVGASSPVIAISIAIGVMKSVLVMVGTPFVAKYIGLNNASSAMIFGGVMGTTSGVTGGLAATDVRLVPYGALTSTFLTGLGCLVAPSLFYFTLRAMLGG